MKPTTVPESLSLIPRTTAPSSPVEGQIYLDGSVSPAQYLVWNGTAWVNFIGAPIAASVYMAVTTPVAATTAIPFDTTRFDTSSAIASGVFTAPTTGYYNYAGTLQISAPSDILIYKNGALYEYAGFIPVANEGMAFGSLIDLAAGDTFDIRLSGSVSVNGVAGTPVSFLTINQVK